MGKERKYEFGYLSKEARMKIISSRVIVFAGTLICLLFLLFDQGFSLSGRLQLAAWILNGVFAYLNLMDVEIDVMELFDWGFNHRGVEFAIAGFLLMLTSAYVEFVT